MTTKQLSDESIELFRKLFSGFEDAHGQYEINRTEDSGKKLGKAVTYPRPASAEDYARHLSGVTGIGIIPLLKDDRCWFGAIDIDIKGDTKLNEDHMELEAKVRKYKLPLMLFRSKSNGAHLYLFAKNEPISARLMQSRLAEFATLLGYRGCEVFPKQITRLKRDNTDYGNWINIPLCGDERVGIFEGKELTKEVAINTSNYLAITEEELRALDIEQGKEFKDGPPCLQQLAAIGIGEGGRNNILFNVGVYLRLKDNDQDEWQDQIYQFNEEKVDPPLPNDEMRELIKQISRKDYFYTCKQTPICNFCDRQKCLSRRYGVGNKEDGDGGGGSYVLPIVSITKYVAGDGQSFRWGVSTSEAMIDFTTEELMSVEAHRKKFVERMNFIIPNMKPKQFMDQIQKLLDKAEVVYDPEDASEEGDLINNIEDWFVTKSGARTCDEMVKRLWWKNPENDNIYFVLSDLLDFLVHQRKLRNINRHKLSRLLQTRMKADKDTLRIKGKRKAVYVLKEYGFFYDNNPLPIRDIERKEDEI